MGIYTNLEDKWYGLVDKVDEYVPIGKVVDKVDKVVPSFLVFLAIIFLLLIILILVSGILDQEIIAQKEIIVLSQENIPIPNANLIVDSECSFGQLEIETDSSGKAIVAICNESIYIRASKNGYIDYRGEVTLADDKIIIKLLPITASFLSTIVTVQVVDNKQAIINDAKIEINCDNNNLTFQNQTINGWEIELRCNSAQIKASAIGYEQKTVILNKSEQRKIIVLEEEDVRGTVYFESVNLEGNGEKAEILMTNEFGENHTYITNNLGTGNTKIPQGNYTYTATSTVGEIITGSFELNSSVVVNIEFERSSSGVNPNNQKYIAIELTNDLNEPIPAATIEIYKSDGNKLPSRKTSTSGRTTPAAISDETLTLKAIASATGYETKIFDVILQENGMYQKVNLSLGGAKLKVNILDDVNKVEPKALVQLRYQGLNAVFQNAYTDSNGQITFNNLPNGTYQIFAIDNAKKDEATAIITLAKNDEKEITLILVTGLGKIRYRFYDASGSTANTTITAYEKENQLISIYNGPTISGTYTTPDIKKGLDAIVKTIDANIISHETIPYTVNRGQLEKEVYLKKESTLPNQNSVQVILDQVYKTNPITSNMNSSTRTNKLIEQSSYWLYFTIILNNENQGTLVGNFYTPDNNLKINNIYSTENSILLLSKSNTGKIIEQNENNDLVSSNAVQANVKINNIAGKKSIPVIVQIQTDQNATNAKIFFEALHINDETLAIEQSLNYSKEFIMGESFCFNNCPAFFFDNYLEWENDKQIKQVFPISEPRTKLLLGDNYKLITKLKNNSDTDFSNIEFVSTIKKSMIDNITFQNDLNQVRHSLNLPPLSIAEDKNVTLNLINRSNATVDQTIEKIEGGINTLRTLEGTANPVNFAISNKNQLIIEISPNTISAQRNYPIFLIKTRFSTSSQGVSANWQIKTGNIEIDSGTTDANGISIISLDTTSYNKGDEFEFFSNDDEGSIDGYLKIVLGEDYPEIVEEDVCLTIETPLIRTLNKSATSTFTINSAECDEERVVFLYTDLVTSARTITIQPQSSQTVTITATPRGNLLGAYPLQIMTIYGSSYKQIKHLDIIVKDQSSCFDLENAIFDLTTIDEIASKITNNCFSGRKDNFYPQMNISTRSVGLDYDKPGTPEIYNFKAVVTGMAIESTTYGFTKSDSMYVKETGGRDNDPYDVPLIAEEQTEAAARAAKNACELGTYMGEYYPKPMVEIPIEELPEYEIYQPSGTVPIEGSTTIIQGTQNTNDNPNTELDDWVLEGESTLSKIQKIFFQSESYATQGDIRVTQSSSEMGDTDAKEFTIGESTSMIGTGSLPDYYETASEAPTSKNDRWGHCCPGFNRGPYHPRGYIMEYAWRFLNDVYGTLTTGMPRPPDHKEFWGGVIEHFNPPLFTVIDKKSYDKADVLTAVYLGGGDYFARYEVKGDRDFGWEGYKYETSWIKAQVDNIRVAEFVSMRAKTWEMDTNIVPIEGRVYRIGSYVSEATPEPKSMNEKTVHGYEPGETWVIPGTFSLNTATCVIPNGFVDPERAAGAKSEMEFPLLLEDGLNELYASGNYTVEYDPSGIIMYKIPEETIPKELNVYLQDGQYYAEYIGTPTKNDAEINFRITKNNILGDEYAILEIYDWTGNEIKKQSFQIKLKGPINSCVSTMGDLGVSGREFVPRLSFNWDWQNISDRQCDPRNPNYTYCDATQFTISLFKKLTQIENLLLTNRLNEVAKETSYYAYLIKDNYNQSFLNDFANYYSTNVAASTPSFNENYKYFILDNKLEFDSNMPYGGLYRVEIDITNINQGVNSMFTNGRPNQNVKIKLTPHRAGQNYSPFYELPFNGPIGQENRNGYGVVSANNISIDNSINLAKNGNGIVNLNTTTSTGLGELKNGIVLDYTKDGEFKFNPSQPTPIVWKITSTTGKVNAKYEINKNTTQGSTTWKLTSSTIGGRTCQDFENRNVFNFVANQTGNTYSINWNGTTPGTIGLSTTFFTPQVTNADELISIIPKENTQMLGKPSTQNNTNVILNYLDSIQRTDYTTLKGMFDNIRAGNMCITNANPERVKIFWNPEYLEREIRSINAGAGSSC